MVKYSVPSFNILEEQVICVTVAHPEWVKAVKGNKDGTKDSKWIGDRFDSVWVWFPVASFRQRIFVFFGSLPATVTSWILGKAVRKTVFKTHLSSATKAVKQVTKFLERQVLTVSWICFIISLALQKMFCYRAFLL